METFREVGKQRSGCIFPAVVSVGSVRSKCFILMRLGSGAVGRERIWSSWYRVFFGLVGFGFCHYCELQQHVISPKGCKTRHDRPFVICELS